MVEQLAAGPFRLGQVDLDGRIRGPIAAPALEADLKGTDLEGPRLRFSRIAASVRGMATDAEVSLSMLGEGAELQAAATVRGGSRGVAVQGVRATLKRGGQTARLRASLVTLTGREQRLEDGEVLGLGEPLAASLRASPGSLVLSAHGRGLDLARVARFAGVSEVVAGRAVVDVDVSLQHGRADGHVALDVVEATVGALHDVGAHLDVTLDDRHASGAASAHVRGVGDIAVCSSSIGVGGTEPLGLSSWRSAWGIADVQAHVDLAGLETLLPSVLRARACGGALDVRGHVGRDSASDTSPDVDIWAKTTDLLAVGPPDAPWTLKGVNGEAHLVVDARALTSLDARLTDTTGVLIALVASSPAIPYARLLSSSESLLDIARRVASSGSIMVPARELATLPPLLGTTGIRGLLSASMTWNGTPDEPVFDAHAALERGDADVRMLDLLANVTATAHYDGTRADATLLLSARGAPMLDASAHADARASDLLASLSGPSLPWRASAKARLIAFPLQSLAMFDELQVHGRVSGEVSVDGLHDDARAAFDLKADELSVGPVACNRAELRASFDGSTLDASTRIEHGDGSLVASARLGARWGTAMSPRLDASQPASVELTARRFRAQLLLPLLPGVFTELDGRIDARVNARTGAMGGRFAPSGTVRISDGVFQLTSLGGEFHDAAAELVLTGDGLARLENASAKGGVSGELEAAATARFAGLRFEGARGVIEVPRRDPLPIVLDGVQVGSFNGHVGLDVAPAAAGTGLDVKVAVDRALLQLPPGSTHGVEALGPIQGVTFGFHGPGGKFMVQSLDGPEATTAVAAPPRSQAHVTISLGSDVEVKRGGDLDVRLAGSTTLTLANDVRAVGQIRLLRGSIEVQGKTFTLQNGAVTFTDDPTNPQVVLTASWPAPDGTTIYADFVGPLKTGKVKLRADPPRPANEILSLVLFGTTDEQAPAGAGLSAQQSGAVGAAAGAAAVPINQALGGFNRMLDSFGWVGDVSTKVDTSEATPRPEVEVRIARDISVQVAWVLGVPLPTQLAARVDRRRRRDLDPRPVVAAPLLTRSAHGCSPVEEPAPHVVPAKRHRAARSHGCCVRTRSRGRPLASPGGLGLFSGR
jgi:translocation and assembly module TamB